MGVSLRTPETIPASISSKPWSQKHSLNLPGSIVGLKCHCAAGVKHLSLPVPTTHLWDSLYSSKDHTQYCKELFRHKRQIFIINCGIWFLVSLSFGLWKAHSISVLQLLFFMEFQGFANSKHGLSETEKFGYRLFQSRWVSKKIFQTLKSHFCTLLAKIGNTFIGYM